MLKSFLGTLAVCLLCANPALAVDVSECGQPLAEGDTAVLIADLNCGALVGVLMPSRATLDLNGHSITSDTVAVHCNPKNCTILGPGSLSSANSCAIQTEQNSYKTRVTVSDVEIHDSKTGICAGTADLAKFDLTNVTVRNSIESGISGQGADGAGSVKGTNLTIIDNGVFGVSARKIKLRDSTITGNGSIGVFSWLGKSKLVGSTVTGNDIINGFDIASGKKPRFKDGTCERSAQSVFPDLPDGSSPTWGICTLDP